METYFIVELKRRKKSGKVTVNAKEKYIVNSMSVTEAEARILQWIPSDFENPSVKSATKSTITEVMIGANQDAFFVAKVGELQATSENSEKVFHNFILVSGKDFADAVKNIVEAYKNSMNWHIASMAETKILYDQDLVNPSTEKAVNGLADAIGKAKESGLEVNSSFLTEEKNQTEQTGPEDAK